MNQERDDFRDFAKPSSRGKQNKGTREAVIYTRVSTKDQADNRASLTTQLNACNAYAQRNSYEVVQRFGGTHESAKNDERKEFQKMIGWLKRHGQNVGYIIVYSLDRFSRSGGDAIGLLNELTRRQGVRLISVTQAYDAESESGELSRNMQLLFSQYENDQRRAKCIAGMQERLRQGFLVGHPPLGYTIGRKGSEQQVLINPTGKVLAKAFQMKAERKMTNVEIVAWLNGQGVKVTKQRLTDIFRNIFYCGRITH